MASDKMLGSFDQKTTPEDNDLLVEYDAAASKVKNVKFAGVWNWIVKKLTSAVISELQTSNQTIVGAINELNSNCSHYKKLDIESEKKTVTLTYSTYKTVTIIVVRKAMIIFSNGYLFTPSVDSTITTTLSSDYKTLTLKKTGSGEQEYLRIGIFCTDIIPNISVS